MTAQEDEGKNDSKQPAKTLSRRAFVESLLSPIGAVVGWQAFKRAKNVDRYGQTLAELPERKVRGNERLLIVLDQRPDAPVLNHLGGRWSEIISAATGATIGYATNFLGRAVHPPKDEKTIDPRRKLLKRGARTAAGAVLAAAGASNIRTLLNYAATYSSVKSEQIHFRGLIKDFARAGYRVVRTRDTHGLLNALLDAAQNRKAHHKTAVLINAHGSLTEQGLHLIGEAVEGRVPVLPKMMYMVLRQMPGQKLIALISCYANPTFAPAELAEKQTAFIAGNNADPKRVGAFGIPFFSALRAGLRQPDVIEGTEKAYAQLLPRMDAITRAFVKKRGAGLRIVGARRFSL